MNLSLPKPFVKRMEELLQEQFSPFQESYLQPAWQGLRVNTQKTSPADFLAASPFRLTPVDWCPSGFVYEKTERPGKHPYHACGVYYLQEPSAMSVAEALEAKPGERVLDLCAAPGGKSTQIAAAMQGKGLLVANEIHPSRVKALSENIERMGITHTIVTNETPDKLASRFPRFFDRILVDAPCSGEGMFRKLPEAIQDWSEQKVSECHSIQTAILEAACAMLKPGGVLVYSTCTFAPLENEQTIATFLQHHPDYTLERVRHHAQFAPGEPEWAKPSLEELQRTARLWPHLLRGEGHFLARLRKPAMDTDETETEPASAAKSKHGAKHGAKPSALPDALLHVWKSFAAEALPGLKLSDENFSYTLFGEQLYAIPAGTPALTGIKVARAGWHLGTLKKQRFEPSHALALAISPDQAARTATFAADDPQVLRYLKGESLYDEGPNGWTVVTVDGFPLGWGKRVDGLLKNHYPKGLRWL